MFRSVFLMHLAFAYVSFLPDCTRKNIFFKKPNKHSKLSRQETPNSVAVFSCWKSWMPSPCQDLSVRILHYHFCKMSLSGFLHQQPLGPLLQDLCMRVSECLYQEPLGTLVQDHCMRISCATCPCQDLHSRMLQEHWCTGS